MSETSVSLLERLRVQPDGPSWQRLLAIYEPMLRGWLSRYSLQAADVEDVVQEVLAVVVKELPDFQHAGRTGAFRCWLRNVLSNRLRSFHRDKWRRRGGPEGLSLDAVLEQLADPASEQSQIWDADHDRSVAARLLHTLKAEFEPTTWAAFRMVALEARPTAEVAAELNLSANAVRLAKSRVMRRFRQEARGLIDKI